MLETSISGREYDTLANTAMNDRDLFDLGIERLFLKNKGAEEEGKDGAGVVKWNSPIFFSKQCNLY
jgi:hypothetical protein